MSCNCRTEVEAAIVAKLKQDFPTAKDHGAELSGYGFCMKGNSMVVRGSVPYTTKMTIKTKTGEQAKSGKINLMFNFCPHCGCKVE